MAGGSRRFISAAIPDTYARTCWETLVIAGVYAIQRVAICFDIAGNQARIHTRASPYPRHILATSTPDVHFAQPPVAPKLTQIHPPNPLQELHKCLPDKHLWRFNESTNPFPCPAVPSPHPGSPTG
jgi:hypothetical protein